MFETFIIIFVVLSILGFAVACYKIGYGEGYADGVLKTLGERPD